MTVKWPPEAESSDPVFASHVVHVRTTPRRTTLPPSAHFVSLLLYSPIHPALQAEAASARRRHPNHAPDTSRALSISRGWDSVLMAVQAMHTSQDFPFAQSVRQQQKASLMNTMRKSTRYSIQRRNSAGSIP